MILDGVSRQMVVYKVEKDKFRYTSLDVSALEYGIKISKEDYVTRLEDVTDIRNDDHDEDLTRLERKEWSAHKYQIDC